MKRFESQLNEDQNEDNYKKPLKMKRFADKWRNCLFESLKDPSLIVSKDPMITVIKDKYPKSRHHLLVIPTEDIGIDSVTQLTASEVQLIDLMANKGKEIALQMDINSEFRFGFHVNPSLRPLHLHVISQEFDSKYLKTKKHYNSFTTKFFIDSKTVIQSLNNSGKVETIDAEECEQLLRQDMVCHFCRAKISNIPQLKSHLLRHYP